MVNQELAVPNKIPAEQNSEDAITLLRASRQIYEDAKRIGTLQLTLAVSSAVGGTVLAAIFPVAKAWTALYGAIALLVDVILLEPAAKKKQETGAKIQELFDARLYELPWNQLKLGAAPEHETIVGLARTHSFEHPDARTLQDWYPTAVGKLPIEYARLVCQRANMRWDAALRRTFCTIYVILLLALGGVGVGYSLVVGSTMEQFMLSVVMPLLPASVQLVRQYRKQAQSAQDSERTREYLEALWKRAIEQNLTAIELQQEARQLQDELYDRRRRSPAIPSLLYRHRREQYEEQMKQASAKMVEDVLAKVGQDG
jgi:uncharacterized membrane protein YagU involved in acid resistance